MRRNACSLISTFGGVGKWEDYPVTVKQTLNDSTVFSMTRVYKGANISY